jgi:hypothetical protein
MSDAACLRPKSRYANNPARLTCTVATAETVATVQAVTAAQAVATAETVATAQVMATAQDEGAR